MFKPIDDPSILIKPSRSLYDLLQQCSSEYKCNGLYDNLVFTPSELKLLNSLQPVEDSHGFRNTTVDMDTKFELIALETLIMSHDKMAMGGIVFHQLVEHSNIVLPQNQFITRSDELEKRCKILRNRQAHKEYNCITKDVDSCRLKDPEDTIAYQLKEMNRQIIAIAQFIITVAAGFAFGFVGVQLLVGSLDFGFRLLLGIICSLTIALAELYFLANKLSEDVGVEPVKGKLKID